MFGDISVRVYEPRASNKSVGVIGPITTQETDLELEEGIRGSVPNLHALWLGTS